MKRTCISKHTPREFLTPALTTKIFCMHNNKHKPLKQHIMKNKLYLIALGLAFFVACEDTNTQTVDLNAEKTALNTLLDKWQNATLTDDLADCMAADAMVAGTAPSELFTKQDMVDMWSLYYSGNVPEHTYIGERTLKIASDGNSATAIEEYNMPSMSSVVSARNTLHLVKVDGDWFIDFLVITYIPTNEDMPKIEEALSASE